MNDYKEIRTPQLDPLGCLSHRHASLVLQVVFLTLFSVLLLVTLDKVSKMPSPSGQDLSTQEDVYQELTGLKAAVESLCRRCPWDWMHFEGNCYFFSVTQKTWNNSATACQKVGAQLVVIKSDEEKNFLQQESKKKGNTWIGLIDLNQESMWHWIDGSPLTLSFMTYWNKGEPNNWEEEDCAEFKGDGWNDATCETQNFWICKKSATSCPSN